MAPGVRQLQDAYSKSSNLTLFTALAATGALAYYVHARTLPDPVTQARASAKNKDPNRPCRWRLDTETSAAITLRDGRKLGYAEYGLSTGRPIFTIHGLPGCRLEAAVNDDMFKAAGARLIAVDRPGIGLSDPNPGSTVLDHAKDIEHLADYLQLPEYAVWGSSAGGPYALACAAAMPEDKLKAVAVVCGLGLPKRSPTEMLWWILNGFRLGYSYFPTVLRWAIGRDPATRLDIDDETRLQLLQRQIRPDPRLHPKDFEVLSSDHLEDDLRLYSRGHREIYARGPDGFIQAAYPLSKDWGFRLEDVRRDLPMKLWYGTDDRMAPAAHGKEIAKKLGREQDLIIKEETHMSITANWKQKVLEDLLAAW